MRSLLVISALFSISLATRAKWTYYWNTFEKEESGSGAKDTWLRTCNGHNIKQVTRHYAERVHMEGTGKLGDGRFVNLGDCLSKCDLSAGVFNCFELMDEGKYTWGIGSRDNNIWPYHSVASNKLKYGTTVEIAQLVGVTMPGTNGQKHNGCVVVDDEGWSLENVHLDFFVGRESLYPQVDKLLHEIEAIDYTIKACTPLKYNVTPPKASASTNGTFQSEHTHETYESLKEYEYLHYDQ